MINSKSQRRTFLNVPLLLEDEDIPNALLTPTEPSCWKKIIQTNHNVKYILIYSFVWYLATSIFQRDLLSVLVKKLSNSDKDVGFISGAQGITQVLLAVPVGLYGDRFLRQTLVRVGIFVGLVAMGLTGYVFLTLEPNDNLLLFYLAFGVWGAYVVLTNPALESLFADSVETGNRATIFSFKYALLQIASATGPLISVGLFYKLGNNWELSVLRTVLLIGAAIGVFAILFLPCLSDTKGLGKESEVPEDSLNSDGSSDDMTLTSEDGSEDSFTYLTRKEEEKEGKEREKGGPPKCCSCLYFKDKNRTTRWTLAVCDVATSTAAGMTVKFFPLFFVSEGTGSLLGYKFTPIQLSWVYLIMPVCTVSVAISLPKLIKRKCCSRPAAMIICKFFGIAALYTMVFFDIDCVNANAMVSLFIFRTAIMNGSAGIKRSILMDAVPKKQRVRWNSLESITRMTWSGSAALGGWCIDSFGYRQTFLITAIVYTISTTPLLLLLPIVD
jgi:MFS family permease